MTVEPIISSAEKTPKARDAFLIAMLLAVAHFVAVPYYLYLIWTSQTSGVTQFYALAAITIVLGVLFGIGAVLSRRGQPTAGIILVLGVLAVLYPPIATLVSGLGLVLGLALMVAGPMMAFQVLPQRSGTAMTIATVVSGLATLLIDVFGPATRPSLPGIFIQLLAASVIVMLGYFIIRQFRDFSLRVKLIVGLVAVALISTGVVSLAVNRTIQNEVESQVYAAVNSQARSMALILGNEIAKQTELLKALGINEILVSAVEDANASWHGDPATIQAEIERRDQQWIAADAANNNDDPLVQAALSSNAAKELKLFRLIYADHVEIFITDQHGALVATTNRTSDYNQADEGWWQAAYNHGLGAVYINMPEYDASSRILASNIAVPIFSSGGEIIGILRTTYRISGLIQSLAQARVGETSTASLLFPDGNLLNADGVMKLLAPEVQAQIKASATQYGQFIFNGTPHIVSQASLTSNSTEKNTIRSLDWIAVIDEDPIKVSGPLNAVTQTSLLIGLSTLIVVSLLAAIAGQFLTAPILRLTKVTEQIRAGDLNARARVENRDEIGALAETFNSTTEQLQATLHGLEQRVAERTTDLQIASIQSEKRARDLQTIAEVSSSISTEQKIDKLLPLVTRLVSEKFGFYHVGIFLLDNSRRYAVLRAANSEGGWRMLARGHKLEVGLSGIVGRVSQTGTARIALDVGEDATFFNNPDLPETHSEMALPLKARGEIIGVLDVQSTEAGAFSQTDANTLGILADQVAIAIENARLFSEVQRTLSETESLYGQYLGQEWTRQATKRPQVGYFQTLAGGKPIEKLVESDEIQQSSEKGEVVVRNSTVQAENQDENLSTVTIPLKLRGQTIGVLNVRAPSNDRNWSDTEIGMMQSISERVGLALENARLLEDSQRRAARERSISEMSSKIGSAADIDAILRSTVEELGKTLGNAEVAIQISGQTENEK